MKIDDFGHNRIPHPPPNTQHPTYRLWNDAKGFIGHRALMSLKTCTDFLSAPKGSWKNYDMIHKACLILKKQDVETQLMLIGTDFEFIAHELGKSETVEVIDLVDAMLDSIQAGKMVNTKVRRFFAICGQLAKLCRQWHTIHALMRIARRPGIFRSHGSIITTFEAGKIRNEIQKHIEDQENITEVENQYLGYPIFFI